MSSLLLGIIVTLAVIAINFAIFFSLPLLIKKITTAKKGKAS